jgi:hypothetical protein
LWQITLAHSKVIEALKESLIGVVIIPRFLIFFSVNLVSNYYFLSYIKNLIKFTKVYSCSEFEALCTLKLGALDSLVANNPCPSQGNGSARSKCYWSGDHTKVFNLLFSYLGCSCSNSLCYISNRIKFTKVYRKLKALQRWRMARQEMLVAVNPFPA